MVIHHRGEALEVVVTEKAVPERLAFHQQFRGVPGQADGGCDQQSLQRTQALPGRHRISPQCRKDQQSQAGEDHGHWTLGENRQAEHHPGGPPANRFGAGETAPLQKQADAQQGTEQSITHGGAAPHEHQWREGESEGCRHGCPPWATGAWLRPAQQGVGQTEHHRHGRQSGRQTGCPAAERIPAFTARQGVEGPHEPVHKRWFVVPRQTVDPGSQPVTRVSHRPTGRCEQGGRLIHQPRAAESPQSDQNSQDQDQPKHSSSLSNRHRHQRRPLTATRRC